MLHALRRAVRFLTGGFLILSAIGAAQVASAAAPASATPAPTATGAVASVPATPLPVHTGRWILVNLAQQHLYAYDGVKVVTDLAVSTGTAADPTPTGTFQIKERVRSQTMTGPGYSLPNVQWVQYFGNDTLAWQEGYSFHSAYWHSNWGHPMSHGCVNLPTDFAQWLYDWSAMGTTVEIVSGK